MIVHYSESAREEILNYYGDCQPVYGFDNQQTDLKNKRTLNFRKISNTLRYIDDYLNQTYIRNGRNYIEIENIATVEFIENREGEIIVISIYFKDEQIQSSNTTHQSNKINQLNWYNQPQKQVQYQDVSQNFCFGLKMVKSNNGLFNYVDETGQIFYPKQWFKNAEDFKQWNKFVAARVFDGQEWYFLKLDNKTLYPMGKDSYRTENYEKIFQQILAEQEHQQILSLMERIMKI